MTLKDSLILVGCLVFSASLSVRAEVSVYEVEFSDFDEVILEGSHELELSVGGAVRYSSTGRLNPRCLGGTRGSYSASGDTQT